MARECPPPPNVASTYTPLAFIDNPSMVGASKAGMWYTVCSIYEMLKLLPISNISDIQREKGAPGHTGCETSDYHDVKVITYNLIYKHKFTFVN